jgi:hypothetical protein
LDTAKNTQHKKGLGEWLSDALELKKFGYEAIIHLS